MRFIRFYEYHDDYETCEKTYATLCIYLNGDLEDPNAISERLGITPTRAQVRRPVILKDGKPGQTRPAAWFLETRGQVQSKDVRRHVDWLLDQLEGKSEALQQLRGTGCEMVIYCFWLSAVGHGGPTLNPEEMRRLGDLGLGIAFDVYFDDETAASATELPNRAEPLQASPDS